MGAVIEMLGNQHQEVLERLAMVETELAAPGGCDLAAFAGFLGREVAAHFALEEHALFPILGRHMSLSQGPLAVMHAEHTSFRQLLRDLEAGVERADLNQQRGAARQLIELLRAHIAKEDNVLFPMACRLLSPEEQAETDSRAAAMTPSEPGQHG